MDKHTWKQVKTLSSSSHKPSPRWGHSSCVVGEDIVFFGGYADSTYMNDLWAFNSVTMKWRQIQTSGDVPVQRSNCSMNYDKENNQIIIFGGGGANKQRFNSISILNWQSKQWIQITPKQNEVAPWQRTYHAAQFIHPYLIVYGGEGVTDMDDLWIFSFITLSWTEVKIPSDKTKPCARRFHSSVVMGNQFIVIAGCHGKYRCLSDIYSLDLTPLLKTGKFGNLEWKQKKLKNFSILTRWGHSSAVYDNKIYVFGGRFSNDLNDLLVIDFENNSIKNIKTSVQAPPARRRHCAGFIGSSMLIFGGFNGAYFQDLFYINVHEAKSKFEISSVFDQAKLSKFINNRNYSDYIVKNKNNQNFYINIGLISNLFESEIQLGEFLNQIDQQYSTQELKSIFIVLYQGYGDLNVTGLKQEHASKMKSVIQQMKGDKIMLQKQKIQRNISQNANSNRKLIKKAMQTFNSVIRLPEQDFTEYFIENKQKNFYDYQIIVGKNRFLINKIKMMAKSQFFMNIFNRMKLSEQICIDNILREEAKIVYEIFFNFLETDWLVIPNNASIDTFMGLTYLSDYFCIPVLSQICCNELISMITEQNVEKVLNFSIEMKLANLTNACCDNWIKKLTSQPIKISDIKYQIKKTFGWKKRTEQIVQKMFQKISFDFAQNMMEIQNKIPSFKKKAQSNSSIEKENFESNIYNH